MENEIKTKKCSKCKLEKAICCFGHDKNRKYGLKPYCKECRKNESDTNKDKKRKKEWYKKNKKITIDRAKNWSKLNSDRRNKIAIDFYYRDKIENPHIYAWRAILSNTIVRLKKNKNDKTINLLGYSALELQEHITSLFTEGMTWDNWGEWHIDHIKPITSFNSDTPMNVVNALSNLQPLWATTREINGVIYEGNLNKYNNYGN